MITPEIILNVTKDPLDCLRIARADKALLTLELEGKFSDTDRVIDFFTGFARGYQEALECVRKGEVKV